MPNRLVSRLTTVGITLRLVLYILVVAAIPIVLIAVFAYRAGANGIARHTHMHLASVATITAQGVNHWLAPTELYVSRIASNLETDGLLETLVSDPGGLSKSDMTRLSENAASTLDLNPTIQQIDVLSLDSSQTLFSYGDGGAKYAFLPPLPELPPSDGLRVTLPPVMHGVEPPVAIMESALAQNGETIARLAVHVSTDDLMRTLSGEVGLGESGRLYLVDSEGLALSSVYDITPQPGPVRAPQEVIPMTAQPADGLRYTNLAGQEVVGAYAPVDSSPWFVVTEIRTSEAFSDIGRMRKTIIIATSLFFVLLVFVAALISRRVTQPLRVLSAGATQIGRGNLSHRIDLSGSDEVGRLATAFNHMAADLDTTQNRVIEAERTAALRKLTEDNVLQLKNLSQMGLTIASASAIEALVESCPSAVRQLTTADAAAIVLIHGQERTCNLDHALDEHAYSKAMFVADDRLNWLFPDTELNQLRESRPEEYPLAGQNSKKFAHIIDVPLRDDAGDTAGAVIIANQSQDRPFSEQDAELTQIIAGYISASIQKLRKAESLRQSELRAVQALSDLESAQDQLVQSQKMESIGRLAGGIAHDFNNLLTPIMGYAQLSAMAIPPENEQIRTDILEIEKMAVQGSNLTRQLLAFSRRQIIEPTVVNLNTLVLDMDRLLRRVIGEDIEMITHTSMRAGHVRVDPSQIEQIVMNLMVNARDAMPGGGRIDLEIKNVDLDEDFSRRTLNGPPGEYVVLSVTDTGVGIPEDIRPQIFEPFYTTKTDGTGTGLGLATCYGIVKQNGGHIDLESQVGQGSAFSIYLPRIQSEEPVGPSPEDSSSEMPIGNETVLLVEDEVAVRSLAARVLSDQGYTVLSASNGVEALRIADAMPLPEIDLLLTDVIMPIMGGKEVADRLTAMRPDLKVLFTSGYTDDTIARQGILKPGTAFTHKPFSPTELAAKVRQVLDSPLPAQAHERA
ncbi:MAG: ATP-binding protein [SAR202 cluster bacterium]|nr:ATP-binding protein [SAR202 cluster bacterium]